MPSIYNLKPAFQALLRPICNQLHKLGITANQITMIAILLSISMGSLLIYFSFETWLLIAFPVILLIRMALNAIDGMLAREFNMQTKAGALLNEMGDVVSDIALFLPFAYFNETMNLAIIIIVILSILSEMIGVLAITVGSSRRYDGPMGKSDRAFVFGLMALLIAFEVNIVYLILLCWVVVALLIFTIINRWKHALHAR